MAKKIPDWNYQVLKNNFDDNYWIRGVEDVCPEAFSALSNLNKKYNSYAAWVDACRIYDQYIEELYDYYGGEIIVKAYFKKYGEYQNGVVERPKLLMKKKTQRLIKSIQENGIEPSRYGEYSEVLDIEEIDEIISNSNGNVTVDDAAQEIDFKVTKINKKAGKVIEESLDKSEAFSRVKHVYTTRNAPTYDIISAFYDFQDTQSVDTSNIANMSMAEIGDLFDLEEREANEPWKKKYKSDDYVYKYNRIVDSKLQQTIEVAKVFAELGIHPLSKRAKKNMSDFEIKMIRSEIGDMGPLSKKEIKAAKKQVKKYQKQRDDFSKRKDSDSALGEFLTSTNRKDDFNDRMVIDDLISRR